MQEMRPDDTALRHVDPQNPFRNPTEEPDFNPDYSETVPALALPESCLPLLPTREEKRNLRHSFSLVFLTLIFALLAAMTVYAMIQIVLTAVLRQIDMQQMQVLPENYLMIARQYFSDSSIEYGVTMIAFLVGNLTAFFVGCRLTGTKKADLFRLRGLRFRDLLVYIGAGLLMQAATGEIADFLVKWLRQFGISLTVPDASADGSWMRILMLTLYAVIVAPITEELLLRGFVLKNICRVSQRLGIFLSAFLFAVMHENLIQMLFAFPFGLLLGYITIKHHSVTPAIIVHMTVNFAAVAVSFAETHLSASLFQNIYIVYLLAVLLLGSAALIYLLLTERMPVNTPYQTMRGMRVAAGSVLFWTFLCVHLLSAWAATLI